MRSTLAPLALLSAVLSAAACVAPAPDPDPDEVPAVYRDAHPATTFDLPLADGGPPVRIGIAPTSTLLEDGAYWVEASLSPDDSALVRSLSFELTEPRGDEHVAVLSVTRDGTPAPSLRAWGRSETLSGAPETTLRVRVETTRGAGEGRFQVGTLR